MSERQYLKERLQRGTWMQPPDPDVNDVMIRNGKVLTDTNERGWFAHEVNRLNRQPRFFSRYEVSEARTNPYHDPKWRKDGRQGPTTVIRRKPLHKVPAARAGALLAVGGVGAAGVAAYRRKK